MALTEREKAILKLHSQGLSDYKIARKLKITAPNVTRSKKSALLKLQRAKTDLEFFDGLSL
jgi:DNA-binding NarL/FixJ family response regulator